MQDFMDLMSYFVINKIGAYNRYISRAGALLQYYLQ